MRLSSTARRAGIAIGLTAAALAAVSLSGCDRMRHAGGSSHATLPGAGAEARKAGLWEQKVSDGKTSQVTRLCLDAGAHRAMEYLGDQLNRDLCTKHDMKQAEDGAWTFASTCRAVGGGEVTTTGSATGDFTSHYQITMTRVEVGGTSPGQTRYVVDAAWKGACPADMKPGDIVLADGRKTAISQVNPDKGS
jgi:hypothetical protein